MHLCMTLRKKLLKVKKEVSGSEETKVGIQDMGKALKYWLVKTLVYHKITLHGEQITVVAS